MVKMSKEIGDLKRKLAQKEAQLAQYYSQAEELANIGPLKSHIENLEFCLEEKQQALIILQVENSSLKQQVRDTKKDSKDGTHKLELLSEVNQGLKNINIAQEDRID